MWASRKASDLFRFARPDVLFLGRSPSCALQPMSPVKTKTAITELNRIILSSHFGNHDPQMSLAKKGEPRSQCITIERPTRQVNPSKHCFEGEFNSILGSPPRYLITLSALASTFGGIVTPICLAVFRLITSSNFLGCSTDRSAGLAPFRILSTKMLHAATDRDGHAIGDEATGDGPIRLPAHCR